jgi:hypothetical protein
LDGDVEDEEHDQHDGELGGGADPGRAVDVGPALVRMRSCRLRPSVGWVLTIGRYLRILR